LSTSLKGSALLGARRPTLRSVPTFATSAGSEAVRLAASCGLHADAWQNDVLHDALGELPDGRWAAPEVCLIVGRQNGKGGVLEIRVLAGLTLFGEKLILWSSHEMKTSMEAFRRVEALIDGSDDLKRRVKANGITRGNGKEQIEFRNGARLKFVARSSGSGRGFSGDCVILDEAYALDAGQLSALMPTLSARPNPQIWYTSSPPLTSDSGEPLFRLRDRAVAGSPGLAYFDWGLQGHDLHDLSGVDLDDRAVWAATNPAYGIRLTEGFTSLERAGMTAEDFARERLGVWPPRATAGAQVISDDLWKDLADRGGDPERPADLAFAIDVNRARSHTSISAVGPRADGVMVAMLIDYRRGTDWVPARMAELKAKWNPVAIGLDIRSEASTVALELAKLGIKPPADPDRPKRGDLAVPTAGDVATAFGLFVDLANNRGLCHLDEAQLNVALAGAKTRDLAGGRTWDRKGDTDISPLVSVTNAHWAYVTRVELVRSTYDPLMNIF
jgi:hypothetical protein